jgi:hypothetical protein
MLCPETACCVVCILLLIWFFTAGSGYQMAGSGYQMAGGRHQMAGGRHQMASSGRRSGYLIYPYVDLSAPGPDGDQYVLHTCHGR